MSGKAGVLISMSVRNVLAMYPARRLSNRPFWAQIRSQRLAHITSLTRRRFRAEHARER